MKTFKLISVLLLLILGSCVTREKCQKYYPPQVVKTDSVKIKVKETIRDTTFIVQEDSSWLQAYIECDSLGQATLKELLGYRNGSRADLPKLKIKDNVLTANCNCDSVAIHALLKDRESVKERDSNTVETPPPVEVKYIPGWMWFFGITGMISWGALVLYVIFILIKSKLKLWL